MFTENKPHLLKKLMARNEIFGKKKTGRLLNEEVLC
jgi:hypothetical protein